MDLKPESKYALRQTIFEANIRSKGGYTDAEDVANLWAFFGILAFAYIKINWF